MSQPLPIMVTVQLALECAPRVFLPHLPTRSWAKLTPEVLEVLSKEPKIRDHGHVEAGRTCSASSPRASPPLPWPSETGQP